MIRDVLLVDDDEIFRERLARALLHWGVHCVSAARVEEAFHFASAQPFDGAVVDLRMSGES